MKLIPLSTMAISDCLGRQNNMNAVERVYQYSNEGTIPQEAAYENSDSTDTPPNGWPVNGEVDFSDVVMR